MPDRHADKPTQRWRLWCGLFALAALPRLLYLVAMRPLLEGYHWHVSGNLLTYGFVGQDGLKTSMYEPAYPVFLAASRFVSGDTAVLVQVLQLAIDSVGAVLLYLLLEARTLRRRSALFGAALYAFYPLLIWHSVVGDEFSLQSVLLVAFAYSVMTAKTVLRASTAGVWLGIAMLTRAMVAPVAVPTTALFVINRRYRLALAFAIAAAAVLSPWLVRNYTISGVIWPTRGGENLLHGNSPYTAALLPEYNFDLLGEYGHAIVARERPDLLIPVPGNAILLDFRDERELDQFYAGLAWEDIRARPLRTVRLTLWKVAYFFWPRLVPSRLMQDDTRIVLGPGDEVRVENTRRRPVVDEIAYTVSYSLVATAALVGVWIRRRHLSQDAVLWCIVFTFVAIHAIYFPATRYRVPMEFVLLFYAAVAFDAKLPVRAARART